MPRRLPVVIAALAVAAILAAIIAAPRTSVVTGVVVAVDAGSLADVRGFTIRTADRQVLEFSVGALENGAEFPPGHLAEHIASGVPVVVTYRVEAGVRTAVRIEDGPEPRST